MRLAFGFRGVSIHAPTQGATCWLEQDDGVLFEHIKFSRILAVEDMDWPEINRLIDLEHSLRIRSKKLIRHYDKGVV